MLIFSLHIGRLVSTMKYAVESKSDIRSYECEREVKPSGILDYVFIHNDLSSKVK